MTEALPLRERRRRDLRAELSDAATRMFLECGFDAVRVGDVARACGVTEKTVFNHFPTKESLLADRWEPLIAAAEAAVADARGPLLERVQQVLARELDELLTPSPVSGGGSVLQVLARYTALVRGTGALVAHERAELARLAEVIASALGRRAGDPAAARTPAVLVRAAAVSGLFSVFYRSLHGRVQAASSASEVRAAVLADVQEAAEALRRGL